MLKAKNSILDTSFSILENELKELINGILSTKNYLINKINKNKYKWGKKFNTMKDLEKFYKIAD